MTGESYAESTQGDEVVGATKNNPCIIVALTLARALGDFIDQQLFAASTALLFDHARLYVYFRDDRPYKAPLVALNPWLTRSFAVEGELAYPFEAFDNGHSGRATELDPAWLNDGCASAHILLTPSMMQRSMLPAFPRCGRLRIPEAKALALDDRLIEAGVEPDRWFCVLHYREPTYRPRGESKGRDLDPETPANIAEHIARDLDGQVVRIGHPGMGPLPNIAGIIDLSRHEDPILLHAHAAARARFFCELSPSGPVHLAGAFGTPSLRCNAVQGWGPLDSESIVVLQHFHYRSGRPIPWERLLRGDFLSGLANKQFREFNGITNRMNTLDEIYAAIRDMLERTRDSGGWRTQVPVASSPAPNCFNWPLAHGYRHDFKQYGPL